MLVEMSTWLVAWAIRLGRIVLPSKSPNDNSERELTAEGVLWWLRLEVGGVSVTTSEKAISELRICSSSCCNRASVVGLYNALGCRRINANKHTFSETTPSTANS